MTEYSLDVSRQELDMLQASPRLTRNNFDLLRLLFAGAVCLVHAYELSGYPALAALGRVLSADAAVKAFFVVSGFLIFMSFERSTSTASYLEKRIRRIYPAYLTVIMICAVGFAGISSRDLTDYFFSREWTEYVAANLSFLNFLQPALPGVFEGNRGAAVNGALWTLKIEVMFYLSVPLLVLLFRRLGHLRAIAGLYFLSVAYALVLAWAAERTGRELFLELGRQLPGQLCYFLAGAFFYYQLPLFERHASHFVIGAAAMLGLDAWWSQPFLAPFALATIVLFFALFLYAGNFGKYGDFSYGVYILHFPILQCFLQFGWLADTPWLFLAVTVLTTALAAVALWHLVEKRFLLRNSHYIAVATSTRPPELAPA